MWINEFDEIGLVFKKKIFDPYFLSSTIVDVEGMKTTLKVGGVEQLPFLCKSMNKIFYTLFSHERVAKKKYLM